MKLDQNSTVSPSSLVFSPPNSSSQNPSSLIFTSAVCFSPWCCCRRQSRCFSLLLVYRIIKDLACYTLSINTLRMLCIARKMHYGKHTWSCSMASIRAAPPSLSSSSSLSLDTIKNNLRGSFARVFSFSKSTCLSESWSLKKCINDHECSFMLRSRFTKLISMFVSYYYPYRTEQDSFSGTMPFNQCNQTSAFASSL